MNKSEFVEQIAQKTDLTVEYVRGVIQLLENGEHRLLAGNSTGPFYKIECRLLDPATEGNFSRSSE